MRRLVYLWLGTSLDMVIFLPGIHSHVLSLPDCMVIHYAKLNVVGIILPPSVGDEPSVKAGIHTLTDLIEYILTRVQKSLDKRGTVRLLPKESSKFDFG